MIKLSNIIYLNHNHLIYLNNFYHLYTFLNYSAIYSEPSIFYILDYYNFIAFINILFQNFNQIIQFAFHNLIL